jgi:hypothetical protein
VMRSAGGLGQPAAAGVAMLAAGTGILSNPGGHAASASAAAHAHAHAAADPSARLSAAEEENRRLRQIMAETRAILNKV